MRRLSRAPRRRLFNKRRASACCTSAAAAATTRWTLRRRPLPRRPLLSRRQAADARKQALASGTFGTFDASRGGWLEAWDDVAAPRVLTAPKLHKRERTRADRFASIEANLADMPKKIAAYRAAVDARKPPPGVESLMKRLTRRRK